MENRIDSNRKILRYLVLTYLKEKKQMSGAEILRKLKKDFGEEIVGFKKSNVYFELQRMVNEQMIEAIDDKTKVYYNLSERFWLFNFDFQKEMYREISNRIAFLDKVRRIHMGIEVRKEKK